MITVESVDPRSAGQSAALLSTAWKLPSLRYTAGYLNWQLAFPGEGPVQAVAVAATGPSGWIGFAGATPRRVEVAGHCEWLHLVSFVAVHPEWQGQGISSRLYEVLLAAVLSQAAGGVVTFAQKESAGMVSLRKGYARSAYTEYDLGAFDSLGWVVRPPPGGKPSPAGRPAGLPAADSSVLVANYPSQSGFEHYLADPRGARWVDFGPDAKGRRRGVLAVQAERQTIRGVEPFLCVTNSFGAPFSSADALAIVAELGDTAQSRIRTGTIPNARGWTPEVARVAGMRTLPGQHRGFFYRPAGQPAIGLGGRVRERHDPGTNLAR